jgi:hypothetical protein
MVEKDIKLLYTNRTIGKINLKVNSSFSGLKPKKES